MGTSFTPAQRAAIYQARRTALKWAKQGRTGWDLVDIACETDNFFWSRLDDRKTRVALRLICWNF